MVWIRTYDNGFVCCGHVNFAPKGCDLVCSAISGIVFGTIGWFFQNNKQTWVKHYFQDAKTAKVVFVFVINTTTQLLLSFFYSQIATVANQYGSYVKLKNFQKKLKYA